MPVRTGRWCAEVTKAIWAAMAEQLILSCVCAVIGALDALAGAAIQLSRDGACLASEKF